MKRFFVLFLVCMLAVTAVFANGDDESATGSEPATTSAYEKKSIAVVYSTFTDMLGSEFKGSLESLAQYFNIDFHFIETGYNTEEAQAKTDAMFQMDLDGVIFVSPTVATLEAAYKRNIPVIALNEPVDEETGKQLRAYPNYLGGVVNDDYAIGRNAAKALYDAGCRKICISYLTPGTSKNHQDRYDGFKDALKNYPDMIVLSESSSRAQWPAAVKTFAAAFPEMDGLFSTAFSEPGYNAIKKNGLVGKFKLATADISESTADYIDNGVICSISGGQYNKIMLAFAALYNYLYDGTRILDTLGGYSYTPFIQITSSKDYKVYEKYVTGGTNWVYTPQIIEKLIMGINPDMTPEKFDEFCKAYSISQVMSLRSGN
jgi:ABC-type sugar transport system substrate-binding protein